MEINITNLSKVYNNEKWALDKVDLQIGNGLFGLLGPNGAGKTTLMRILVTLLKPSTGDVKVDDLDLYKDRKTIRRMLGYLPQDFNTFPKVKTWEFLDYCARLSGMAGKSQRINAVDQMLDKVGLFNVRDRLANKLSGGMKRRLGIAQALIADPKILVVDEPTTGLDPEERIRFRNLLTDMGEKDRIIILSTHIVGDISSTCKDMALLRDGKVDFKGSPEELVNMAKGHTFQLEVSDNDLLKVKEHYAVISTIPSENGWQIQIVADKVKNFPAQEIEPDIEHAYVYFMEMKSGFSQN